MPVLTPGMPIRIRATKAAQAVLFGGAPLDGERHLWWNFVASSRDRIERAKRDWRTMKFGQIPGETEFIPLPES